MTTWDFLCYSQTIPQILSMRSFSVETQFLWLPFHFKMERMRTWVPSVILVASSTFVVT